MLDSKLWDKVASFKTIENETDISLLKDDVLSIKEKIEKLENLPLAEDGEF